MMLALSIMLRGIIPVAIVFFLIGWAFSVLTMRSRWPFRVKNKLQWSALWQAIGVSIGTGIILVFSPMLGGGARWLAIVFWLLAVAFFVNLFVWWGKQGVRFKEAVPMVLLSLMAAWAMSLPSATLADWVTSPFWSTALLWSPWVVLTAYVGYVVVMPLWYHYKRHKKLATTVAKRNQPAEKKSAKKFLIWAIIATVVFGLLLALMVTLTCVHGAQASREANPTEQTEAVDETAVAEGSEAGTGAETLGAGPEQAGETEEVELPKAAKTPWYTKLWHLITGKPLPDEVITDGVSGKDLDLPEITEPEPTPEEPGATEPAETVETVDAVQLSTSNDGRWVTYWPHYNVILDNYDQSGKLLEGEALQKAILNDYDFDHSPLQRAVRMKIEAGGLTEEEVQGKTERELYNLVGPGYIVSELIEELKEDPAKGAGVLGYWDAFYGERSYIGEFFSEYKDHPDAYMTTINACKDDWSYNQSAYYKKLNHFVNELKMANYITIRYQASGITDQMYQTGARVAEEIDEIVPDVIVMESYEHSGYFLVIGRIIKGEVKEISYRLDCGFQPCNVEEVLETTPQANPNGPNRGNPSNGDPNQGDPYVPDDDKKNKDDGTPPWVNDSDGPGDPTSTDTNFSTVDQPSDSTHYDDPQDYYDEADKNSSNPGTSSDVPADPTYSPPVTPDGVDNNGHNGTGHGGANTPTPVTPADPVDDPHYDPNNSKTEWGSPGL